MDKVCEFPLSLLGSPWRKFTSTPTSTHRQYNLYYKCQHEYQWPSFYPASRVCASSMGRKLQDEYKYKSSAPLSVQKRKRELRITWQSRDRREPASSTATGRVRPRPPHTLPLHRLPSCIPTPAPHVPALHRIPSNPSERVRAQDLLAPFSTARPAVSLTISDIYIMYSTIPASPASSDSSLRLCL